MKKYNIKESRKAVNEGRPGYKQTPLGWIPEEWEVKRLQEICSHFKSGIGITSEYIEDAGDFPVYGGNGLRGYTTSSTHDGNYLLIGRQGALCGNIQKITGKNYISEHAIAVQTNSLANLDFLAHKLEFKNLNRLSESSAQPGLAVDKLLRIRIDLPPINEQEYIALILSTWDSAITKTQHLIEQLKRRNKGLLQELLTGTIRLPGFEDAWKEIQLSDAFSERTETGLDTLELLSVGSNGIYPQSQSEKRDISNADKSKYKRIYPGDIGYNTMRMWQGRSALSSLEGIISPAYTVITPKKNQSGVFYSLLFQLPSVINKFFRNSQGLVEDTLNCKFKDLAKVKVYVPGHSEQVAISRIILTQSEEVSAYEKILASLYHSKKGMMQKLLSGEVLVTLTK